MISLLLLYEKVRRRSLLLNEIMLRRGRKLRSKSGNSRNRNIVHHILLRRYYSVRCSWISNCIGSNRSWLDEVWMISIAFIPIFRETNTVKRWWLIFYLWHWAQVEVIFSRMVFGTFWHFFNIYKKKNKLRQLRYGTTTSFEPDDVLSSVSTIPTQKLFCFNIFRQPQRVGCLAPRWETTLSLFPISHGHCDVSRPHRE